MENHSTSLEDSRSSTHDLNDQDVIIFMLPWCHLCETDLDTVRCMEENMNSNEKIESTCRFVSEIFIKDFPPDIFFNRPWIIEKMFELINSDAHRKISFRVLDTLVDALLCRIKQVLELDIKNYKILSSEYLESVQDKTMYSRKLNQLPLPYFCLDLINLLLNKYGQNVFPPNARKISVKEMNNMFNLCLKLSNILTMIVKDSVWLKSTSDSISQQIINKTTAVMRTCGDLLGKYWVEFHIKDIHNVFYRVNYIRTLSILMKLVCWSHNSQLIPTLSINALSQAVEDVSMNILYPQVYIDLYSILKNIQDKSLECSKKFKFHQDIERICKSFSSAVIFFKEYNQLNHSQNSVRIIKDSLPSVEYHRNMNFVKMALNLLSKNVWNWCEVALMRNVNCIILDFIANNHLDVQKTAYRKISSIVSSILGGHIRSDLEQSTVSEKSLLFVLSPLVLAEIVSYGIYSDDEEISVHAQNILSLILRSKLLISQEMWSLVLEALLPSLPILHTSVSLDNDFGKSVMKTLDPEIGKCMLIPRIDLIKGNIRLLFTKSLIANMEGSANLINFLSMQEESEALLPTNDSMRADLLCSLVKSVLNSKNLSSNKANKQFYTEGSLRQVLDLLAIKKISNSEAAPNIDPSFKRSAMAQLAVMLQQKSLQNIFLKETGCELITHYLKSSLKSAEFVTFPECAKSCIDMLTSLCFYNASIRQWAAQNSSLILNIIRSILLFPNDAEFLKTALQALCLIIFSEFTMNSMQDSDEVSILSIHNSIVRNVATPFPCHAYAKTSPHKRLSLRGLIMENSIAQKYVRISWCISWFGGVDNIIRWPYITNDLFPDDYFNNDVILKDSDLSDLKITSIIQGCSESLYNLQHSDSFHVTKQAIQMLSSYVLLSENTGYGIKGFSSLPWCSTFKRFLDMNSSPSTSTDFYLLTDVLNFFSLFSKLCSKNCQEENPLLGCILDSFGNANGLISILQFEYSDIEDDDNKHILRQQLLQCLKTIIKNFNNDHNYQDQFYDFVNTVLSVLSNNLRYVVFQPSHRHVYLSLVLECIASLTNVLNINYFDANEVVFIELIEIIFELLTLSDMGKHYTGFKGNVIVQNCFIILCHLLDVYINNDIDDIKFIKAWSLEDRKNLFSLCFTWSQHHLLIIRILAIKFLSGLCCRLFLTNEAVSSNLENALELAIINFVDKNESNLLRTEAANLLFNILINNRTTVLKDLSKYIEVLTSDQFFNTICETLKDFCSQKKRNVVIGKNVLPNVLEDREYFQVALSKDNPLKMPLTMIETCLPSHCPELIVAIADLIYAIIITNDSLFDAFFDSDILQLLFSSLFLETKSVDQSYMIKGSIGRVLYIISKTSERGHSILLNMKVLIKKVFEFVMKDLNDDWHNNNTAFVLGWKWMLYYTGILISSIEGFRTLLCTVQEDGLVKLFKNLLLFITDTKFTDISSAALFCLTSIFNNSHYDESKNIPVDVISILDKTVISPILPSNEVNKNKEKYFDKDVRVISENICFSVMSINKLFILSSNFNTENSGFHLSHVSSCTASLLGCSDKAKYLAIDMKFLQDQILCLNNIQYVLTPEKLKNVLKEKSHPVLQYLNYVFQNLCNMMSNCTIVKETCSDLNMLVPIKKLWELCISNKKTRSLVIELLTTFTNSCLKACNSIFHSMGCSSLLKEICDLITKEMNLVSRIHSLDTLKGCFQILENVCFHQHCRSFIIKSDVFDHLNRIHPALTKRQEQWKEIELIWESFALTISKYPEGQVKLSDYFTVQCALAHQADFIMLPVIRNCSFNSSIKTKFLQSADILSLFSQILTGDKSVDAKIMVASSLWALAANNAKIKLSLRSVGLTAKLNDCLHRLKYSSDDLDDIDKAVQIISHVTKAII